MINIICFGDSITEGAEFPVNARWPSLLQKKLDAAKPDVFEVHNRGVGGHTSAQGFDRFWSDVLPLLPGVLLIQFGFNDGNVKDFSIVPRVGLAEFEKNLKEFHRIAKDNDSVPVFIINHIIGELAAKQGNGKTYNENIAPYNNAVRMIVNDLKADFIDVSLQMSLQDIDTNDFVSRDKIHLSLEANHIYADIIFSGLNQITL
ncbi:MAG TPA: SGNH/GDSL hydrolase family protein [Thiotrichaceae bacterium]|jgi:lysophospholipase L1-like esterase|nr:SGNH/GDSL hydrolase family protein [Thiotrichaceae bacterium]HIM07882.1 SGNH/GDSL hydrolase family protein [Gammaproteobacteria bacterium]